MDPGKGEKQTQSLEIPYPEDNRETGQHNSEDYRQILEAASQWNESLIQTREQRWQEHWSNYYFGSDREKSNQSGSPQPVPLFFPEPMAEEYPSGDLGAPYTKAVDYSELNNTQNRQATTPKK